METGLLIRWGQVIPGREEQALALFGDVVAYYEGLRQAGKLSSYEPYMYATSDFETDTGFFILKGPVAEMFAIMDSEEYKTFTVKANLLLHHVSIHLLTVGDGVTQQLDRFNKARVELHV